MGTPNITGPPSGKESHVGANPNANSKSSSARKATVKRAGKKARSIQPTKGRGGKMGSGYGR